MRVLGFGEQHRLGKDNRWIRIYTGRTKKPLNFHHGDGGNTPTLLRLQGGGSLTLQIAPSVSTPSMSPQESRKRVRFTSLEEDCVRRGFAKHGPHWSKIKRDPEFSSKLERRSAQDIRYKWRNLMKKEKQPVTDSEQSPILTPASSLPRPTSPIMIQATPPASSHMARSTLACTSIQPLAHARDNDAVYVSPTPERAAPSSGIECGLDAVLRALGPELQKLEGIISEM